MKSPLEWVEADVVALLGQSESSRLEFKSGRLMDSRDEAIETLSKEVSAFANSEGGTLVIGVREERAGVNRIAASLDGVDASAVPQHWLQQVIESNVSPYLPGIRYRYVRLSGDLSSRSCIVIAVPSGTTAYQAKDRRYYGRSEHEVKALPDHEIRLRMQRSRLAVATLEIFDWTGTGDPDWGVESEELTPPEIAEMMPLIMSSPRLEQAAIRGHFRLGVRNTGEVTLRDFLVECRFDIEVFLDFARGDMLAGPGRDEPRTYRFPSTNVRVYPGDVVRFPDEVWTLAALEQSNMTPGSAMLKWTLFIDNAPKVTGEIDLAQRFAFNARH